MLLAVRPFAFGLDPSLDVSQYAHTAWKVRDGFVKGEIISIAQTPDGYLWLGTEFGLLRFDGVRAVPWQPPPDQHLPSDLIAGLLTSRDGTLWIGTDKGLASWKNGKVTQYPELAGQLVAALFEDREGKVWVGGFGIPTGRLCAIHNGSVLCRGEDGVLGHGVLGLYEDSKGNLWAGVVNGLWRWSPGPSNFYPMPGDNDSIRAFADDADGALLVSNRTGVERLVNGKFANYALPAPLQKSQAEKLLRDRDGSLWIETRGQGLVRIHQGRTDLFAQADGLSGNDVLNIFEDREDNIWVATTDGLDRFRTFAVATLSVNQGLSSGPVVSVLADKNGNVPSVPLAD